MKNNLQTVYKGVTSDKQHQNKQATKCCWKILAAKVKVIGNINNHAFQKKERRNLLE